MTIPTRFRAFELAGKRVVNDVRLENKMGYSLEAGHEFTILNADYGLMIQSDPCPCCGQYVIFSKVPRTSVTLIEDDRKED